jgi:hypothetical protein
MNSQLDNLASLVKDRQAQMRREAWQEQQLRQVPAPRKDGWAMKQKFVLALAAAALIAFAIAQAVTAAGGMGGGGGGGPFRMI